MSWDKTEKNKVRRSVCKKGKAPYKSILMMPGESCLDLKLLLEKGAIDKNTKLHLVERDSAVAICITTHLQRMKLKNFTLYEQDLHNVEFPAETKFDFVYLDTCGQLNEHIINWLSKQVQLGVFEEGARIALAFSQWFRGGAKLYTDYCKFLKKEETGLARVNPLIKGQEETTEYQDDTHKVMGTLLRNLFGNIEESWLYKNSSKAIPMHVFTFKGRTSNTGLISIIKFLTKYTSYEPALISPGIKAAAKRFNLHAKVKKTRNSLIRPKFEETQEIKEGGPPVGNMEIRRLNTLIKEMERRLTNNIKVTSGLQSKVRHLEEKLKEKKEIEVIPYPQTPGLVPTPTDEEIDKLLEVMFDDEKLPI